MARKINRLTAITIKKPKPGRHADGGGLYLLARDDGRQSWVFRYRERVTGKIRDRGLGPAWDVTLAEARERAAECRRMLRDGKDPIDEPRSELEAKRSELARRMTFGQCAERYIAAHRETWRNAKHTAQWKNTLDTYAAALKPLPVDEIDTGHVVKALEPIWTSKTETATRVRQRIESVLDWASARKLRSGENPARWRGHLENLLGRPTKLKNVQPRAALPYADMAAFMAELRARSGYGARALELQILTAARPGEVAGARWDEFDLQAKTWTVPAARMKAARAHRVPLSGASVKLLRSLPRLNGNAHVFPGLREGQPITTAAGLQLLKELRPGVVPHGFRSTFRDWAADQTAYPREIAEAALAHTLKDKTEAAYRRTDLFEKRARLMRDWAKFCAAPRPKAGNVRVLRSAKA